MAHLTSLYRRLEEEVKKSPSVMCIALCALGLLACAISIGTGNPTNRESLLLREKTSVNCGFWKTGGNSGIVPPYLLRESIWHCPI